MEAHASTQGFLIQSTPKSVVSLTPSIRTDEAFAFRGFDINSLLGLQLQLIELLPRQIGCHFLTILQA